MTSAHSGALRPVTLITGAAGGIGRALARLLASDHDLILSGRTSGPLDTLCGELGATPLLLDLTRPDTFEAAVAGLGRVTNVVHNAGVVDLGPVGTQAYDVWTHTLTVNTVAPAELTRLLLPGLRAAQGTVVFVNSGAGLRANAGWASYAASKHALRALADALRDEEAPHGVRVTSVYPGRTATEMQRRVRTQEGADYQPEVFIQPETVAATIAFVLNAPRDASLTDVTVRPGPRA
ncbi:SDR family oxidoreductase [Deinococcus deserti]|uniref:Putative Oxidoreductase, short-chain dehydrogenase/reductase family n=1 Tax=Deinococcus deserti (strain DSM 17065 / CIP 109153 / LMG 22923 / VCD115) TaxID=546414 RepID=C1D1R2_DEIDV|nr:SDR family oxidoreductase [Deinococcus deserti]ACO45786.1 putative Oxidoreductase, short-chain dehydrogenase/reductase family [Deinococcus deserti VCD115]